MKNVKENKRRWKQLVAIFIVAVMLFTTPHIVGFASMGKEEATTAAADGNPDNSDVKVQSEDADSEEDIQTESLDASEQSESSEEKTTEKKTETTEAEKKTGADESKKEKAEETTKKETKATTETAPEETTTEATTSSAKPEPIVKEYKSDEVNVTVTAADKNDLPEDAELVVEPVELSEKTEKKVEEAALKEKRTVKKVHAYDIHFELYGEEIQPGASVQVSVDVPGISAGQNAAVFHVDDNNKVENMNGDVDKKGDVVFETNHFSTYVIVQQGSTKVTATIKHYNDDSTADANGEKKKIYSDDVLEIPVGGRINDYAKASNWNVKKVIVENTNTDGTKKRQNYVNESEYSKITLSKDSTVEVYYTPKKTTVKGQTKFYDYTIMAGRGDGTYWNPNGSTYYSINMPSNPSYHGIGSDSARLTMGESGNDNDNHTISQENYSEYRNYTCNVSNINENGQTKTWNANAWTGTKQVVTGLLKGLDSNGDVEFNYPEPGFFDNSDLSFTSNGKTRYLRKVFTDYKLVFAQNGDSYQLTQVNKPGTNGSEETKVAEAGENFFPLDSIDSQYKNENSTANAPNGHNYYFGMRYDVDFKLGDYIGPLDYEFTGDDDLWVVLDGNKVVLDLGGIHDAAPGKVDLWKYLLNENQTKDQLTTEQKEQEHTLTVLYMERGAGVSNCNMNFTLPSARITQVTEAESTNLVLHKINKKNEALQGARFTLKNEATEEKQTSTSDANGNATFSKLTEGTYTLTEDAAPTNYIPSVDNWVVKVAKNDAGTLVATMYLSDGETAYTKKEGDYYDVLNLTEQELIDSVMDYSKTAKVTDWDKRTYDIDIKASSKLTKSTTITNNEVSDTMLVLDVSGSMLFDSAHTTGSQEYATFYGKCNQNTLNNLDTTKIYYYGNGTRTVWYQNQYSYTNLAQPMIYVDGKWKYLASGDFWVDVPTSSNTSIYTSASRLNGLKEAAMGFVSSMAQSSPNSKLGIATFNSNLEETVAIETIGTNVNGILMKIAAMTASGGTQQDKGLSNARIQLETLLSDGKSKNVILFTDGEPTGTGNTWNSTAATAAENEADRIKEKGIKIYTVGFALNDKTKAWLAGGKDGNTPYKGIASKDCALTADNIDQLKTIFKELQQTMTQSLDIKPAQIKDVIDPRFTIIGDDKKPITQDYTVTKNGTTYNTETGIPLSNGGTVYYGEFEQKDANGNVVKDANGNPVKKTYQYIVWNDETIPNKTKGEWHKTISVVAKEEYIGGNNIPTNISPDSQITTSYGDATLPQPKVNVKADLLVNNHEEKVFYGEKSPYSDDILKQLFDTANPQGEIKTLEGTTKKVTYTIGADGNPIEANDFILKWYKDADCTEEITPGEEYMEDEAPELSEKNYYLKVTYNKMQQATDKSDANTKIGDEVKNNNVPLMAHNSEDSKTREYGVYKITVVPGQIEIEKKLLSDSKYVGAHSKSSSFTFTVKKIKDENGNVLDSPIKVGDFTVTFDKGDTSFTKAVSDDKNLLSNLKKGVYEVSETLPASDYEFKSAEIAGETNCASKKKEEEKNTLIFAIGYEDLNTPGSRKVTKNLGKALYTNERLSSITMKKIGEKDSEDKDTPLKGAKFKIERITETDGKESYESAKADGSDYIIETDENGIAVFEGLKEGKYRITEVQSPKGYSLLANPIEVTLPYVTSNDAGVTKNSEPVKVGDTDYYYDLTYTVKNNKLFDMPEAGGGFRATLFGIAIMIIAGGWYIIRRRRKIV